MKDEILNKFKNGTIPFGISVYETRFDENDNAIQFYDLILEGDEIKKFNSNEFDNGLYTYVKGLAIKKNALTFLKIIGMFEENLMRVFSDNNQQRNDEDKFVEGRIRF